MYYNPYENTNGNNGKWLKANFHTHAGTGKGTCGAYEIDEVISLYKEAGYDVLTISNHDLFSDVQEYESKHDIMLLNGYEYSQTPHMCCIDGKKVVTGKHQEAVDECIEQGGFVTLNHPNWIHKEYWSHSKLDEMRGYTGIEIYNGVIFRLNGTGLATDIWDYLLSQRKLVWGFGSDDFHRWYDLARAWNMIYCSDKTHEGVKAAIQKGSFYVSTGLILNKFVFENNVIKVSASAKETYVKDNKYIFIGKDGAILHEEFGESACYKLTGEEEYVRVQVVSQHGAMLWTQPVYKEGLFVKA
jgi:hypothetical protein